MATADSGVLQGWTTTTTVLMLLYLVLQYYCTSPNSITAVLLFVPTIATPGPPTPIATHSVIYYPRVEFLRIFLGLARTRWSSYFLAILAVRYSYRTNMSSLWAHTSSCTIYLKPTTGHRAFVLSKKGVWPTATGPATSSPFSIYFQGNFHGRSWRE